MAFARAERICVTVIFWISLSQRFRKTDKGLPLYKDIEESDVFILAGAKFHVVIALIGSVFIEWVTENRLMELIETRRMPFPGRWGVPVAW